MADVAITFSDDISVRLPGQTEQATLTYSDDIIVTVRENQEVSVELSYQGPQGPQGPRGDITPEMTQLRDEAGASAAAAAASEDAAADSKAAAAASKTAAATSEQNAAASKDAALLSEQNAAASKDAADASAVLAGQKASDAAAAKAGAEAAQSASETAASDSQAAQAAAEIARNDAQAAQGGSEEARDEAVAARSDAELSEANAAASAAEAAAHASDAATFEPALYVLKANNGSDFDAAGFRTNLDLYSTSQINTLLTAAKARANHTGTQLAATISDFNTAADLRIAGAVGVSVQAFSPILAGTTASFTTALKTKLDGIETAADVTDAANVGSSIAGVAAKTTLVDADKLPLNDSAASNALKTISWANLKFVSKAYFDTLYSALGHTHTFASLTSKPTTVSGYGLSDVYTMTQIDGFLSPKASITYVDGKISDLLGGAPAAALDTIKELADALTDADSDIAAITTSLAGKAALVHTHAIADVTGLQAALDGKAALEHVHAISDITGLQAALNAKAALTHTHAISDITGLQTALDGKAALVHTHLKASITDISAFMQTMLDDADAPTVLSTIGINSALGQSDAPARIRRVGNSIEFGHTSGGFYGTLGAEYSWGSPVLMFFAEHGSTNDTYRTRGKPGIGIRGRYTDGGLEFIRIPAANADNQAPVVIASLDPDGTFREGGVPILYAGTSFLRLADGTQICFCSNVPAAGIHTTQVNFPAAFIDTTYRLYGEWITSPGADPLAYGHIVNYNQTFTTYVNLTTNTPASVGFYTCAIGKWK